MIICGANAILAMVGLIVAVSENNLGMTCAWSSAVCGWVLALYLYTESE